ncbi:MAG: valine--tRNA ligase [Gemmataceae bacterium]|nr:valine--tRNA ligase [Gemmataceae bacterium]
MTTELPKQYDPHAAQARWLTFWEECGYQHSRPDPDREPFTIVIPPPNVTGALHLGHALNNTLQDVLIRYRRMQGFNALWVPGTDHAGIATQAVVERRLREEEKQTRHDLGREALVARIWEWKDQYEARILRQLRELGCSCDWARTRFTLDPVCARAVRHTFFKMFREGLIYRGKRLVNWDTHLQTAVADDEIFHETVKGGFWTFRYPVKYREGEAPAEPEFIRFSTTRPETMLGDTAVAVHPDDERYKHLIGKTVTIPLVNRDIPIIADPLLVDPKLGTGAVKVTPAHDPNDYQCGLRHRLPMINILNPDGTLNDNGGPYAGLDRFTARERVTEDMEKLGLFDGREDRDIDLAHSDRSKTPIEPYLSDQWFVFMGDRPDCGLQNADCGMKNDSSNPQSAIRNPQSKGLAQTAMDAVQDGRVTFFPARYARTYLDWLGEKRDWCISRQLWWGHRIPIWYTSCPEAVLKAAFAGRDDVAWTFDAENGQWLVCAREEDLAENALGEKYPLMQDPDVLDTWFSSALWPHSTLGWPGPALPDQPHGPQNPEWSELRYYYPTSVLVTSRDIITLWVARMVITGLLNVGQVPFHHVYIHPKILDGFGETMSKMKGNGIDPLDIISCYGTDALRYGMVNLATETQDSRMPVSNVCPHCQALVPMKHEHMYLRTRKVTCPECKKPFRPGGPWPAQDPELPTARQASERFEVGRNFANKLWNAARFLLMNLEGYRPEALRVGELPVEDRWILSRLATTTSQVTEALEGYHFSEVARTIYDFTWSEFCDWYVEMSKGRLRDESSRPGVQRVLAGVLDGILRLAHPVMPFVTESIWQALNEAAFERGLPAPEPSSESVMIAPWLAYPAEWQDESMERRIGLMQELVRAVREIRNRYQVDPRTPLDTFVRCRAEVAADFQGLRPFIVQLAGVGALECGEGVSKPPQSAGHVHPEFEVYVSLRGLIDVAAEGARLEKQLAEKRKFLQTTEAKLANEGFVKRAPQEVVQQQQNLAADLQKQIATLEANLNELRQA